MTRFLTLALLIVLSIKAQGAVLITSNTYTLSVFGSPQKGGSIQAGETVGLAGAGSGSGLYSDYTFNFDGETLSQSVNTNSITSKVKGTIAFVLTEDYYVTYNIDLAPSDQGLGLISIYGFDPITVHLNTFVTGTEPHRTLSRIFTAGRYSYTFEMNTSKPYSSSFVFTPTAVPEPSTHALIGLGAISLFVMRRFLKAFRFPDGTTTR